MSQLNTWLPYLNLHTILTTIDDAELSTESTKREATGAAISPSASSTPKYTREAGDGAAAATTAVAAVAEEARQGMFLAPTARTISQKLTILVLCSKSTDIQVDESCAGMVLVAHLGPDIRCR